MEKEQQKPITQAELEAILADRPVDFSNRLLVGINLSHDRGLECSDFRGAVLRGCTFNHCKFDNSHFESADLGDTAFVRCKMEYCFFNNAQMENAGFDRCALAGSTGLYGDTRMQSEVVFDDFMSLIRGLDLEFLGDWRQFIWEICDSDEENYDSMLCELQEKFHEIDRAYPGMGAAIFNSGLHFLPHELCGAANCIAQGNTVETAHKLAVDSAFSVSDRLPNQETFVLPHSDVQKNLLAERAFVARLRAIPGIDFGKLNDWLSLARELSEVDNGVYDNEDYRQQLREFGEAFWQIEQRYPGAAAAMFNCEAAYLPNEILPAAEWISDGGGAEEAVEMARNGDFLAADLDEVLGGPTMTM